MIQIIPSIVIREGKVVKMKQGIHKSEKVYDMTPMDLALQFEDHGIEVVHLVDLDGSKKGQPVNYHILETIAGHTKLKVDFTGGISTDGDISKAYEYGASYITAASIAVSHKELFASWLLSYGREKITLGADARKRKVEIRGWQKSTDLDVIDHISYFYNRGLKYVKTTDIDKDGLMSGPTFELYEEILNTFEGIKVLASGGVRNTDDIVKLNELGVFAVIIGKALYEGRLVPSDFDQFIG